MLPELTLEQFSGPLDLLLSLIQDDKLDISDVAISRVTEQFLAYLDTLEERRAEELADFLVVASRLLLLKSRTLLPQFALEDDDEGPSLADQLRLYKQFVEAAKHLNKMWMSWCVAFPRIEPSRKPMGFVPPVNVSLDTLHAQMLHLVARLALPRPLPETRIDRAISMKQKIDDIRRLLSHSKEIHFGAILREAKNRTEVIVSFLALLELVKQKTVAFAQDEMFGDIVIQRV